MRFPDLNLTTEQRFQLQVYRRDIEAAGVKDLEEIALSLIWQNMVKDNVIKQLIKNKGV